MATVLKKEDPALAENLKHMNMDWLDGQKTQSKIKPGRRIIKAGVSPEVKGKREIPIKETVCDRPEIKTLGTGDSVEGLEIVCQCGQKMVIHFNYDGNDTQDT